MTRTILRLHTRSIETNATPEDGMVVVRSGEGSHRFQAIEADRDLLREHALAHAVVEVVVLADLSDSGAIVGGEILEVVGPVELPKDESSQSGVVLRRTIIDVDVDVDDVDFAFDRIRNG